MIIEKLHFTNIRNLGETILIPSPTINFIVGSNGSGKSSLLEAISLITSARSFRTKKSSKICNSNQREFTVFAKIVDGSSRYNVGLHRDNHSDQFKIRINLQTINRASTLAGYFPQLTISPEQCDLIDGSPERRRSFIDWSLFHVKHDYSELASNYRKVLSQRNSLLRLRDSSKLNHWDKLLSEYGESINSEREQFFQTLLETLKDKVTNSFNIELDLKRIAINYASGWKKGLSFYEVLEASRNHDIERGYTQQGPHRADFRVCIDNMPVREILSRGEKKLLQVLLTVAQLVHFRDKTGSDPVILMDDIFAELDSHNIELLFSLMRQLGLQLFITATDLINVDKYVRETEKVFHVKHGLVTEMV
jgi:DNA replication and repair protein RecF